LQAQNLKVVVPYPALLESYSLIMRKLGNREAHEFLAQVVSTAILENATTEDYQEACVTILPYRDQNISLFDAVIAEMSERLEAAVWTYDHHFDRMRANVWR
jgi:predicted nucleic acid-binding protein